MSEEIPPEPNEREFMHIDTDYVAWTREQLLLQYGRSPTRKEINDRVNAVLQAHRASWEDLGKEL